MANDKKAVLAVPSGRGEVRIETMASAIRMVQAFAEIGVEVTFMSVCYAEPAMARNRITASFLKTDADILMMLDDDVSLHPPLGPQFLGLNQPFIGVYLPQRQINLETFAQHVKAGKDPHAARLAAAPLVGPTNDVYGGVLEVNQICAGFLMLRRSVFELIDAASLSAEMKLTLPGGAHQVPGYFNNITDPETGAFLSEDYSFCRRYRAAGGKIIAYKGPGVTHYGVMAFQS